MEERQIRVLQKKGFLGDRYFKADYIDKVCQGKFVPKVNELTQKKRTEIWAKAVENKIRYYLNILGYQNLAK